MIGVVTLVLGLASSVQSHASIPVASFVDRNSIADEMTQEFLMMMAPAPGAEQRWKDLVPRLTEALRERARTEPARATRYRLQPWRETIGDRVDVLAKRFAHVVATAMPNEAVEETLVELFVDLNVALTQSTGADSGVKGPAFAGAGALYLGAAAAYGFDHTVATAILSSLGTAVGLVGTVVDANVSNGTYDDKRRVAREMADRFWDRVEVEWRTLAPLDLDAVDAGTDAVSAAADAKLNIGGTALADACARWLEHTSTSRI